MRYTTMGKTIQIARSNADINQIDFAEALGWTSGQFISNIERGLASIPAAKFKKVAKILKINVELLVKAHLADEERRIRSELKNEN